MSIGEALASVTDGALADFESAFLSAFEAIGEGSGTAGDALAQGFQAGIGAIGRGLARVYFAKGTAALADSFAPPPLGGPHMAVAAAKYFGASALFAALAGAAGGQSQTSGGGGGRGGDSSSGGLGSRNTADGTKGTLTIIWPQGSQMYDMSDPRQEAAFVAALEDVTDRKVIIDRR